MTDIVERLRDPLIWPDTAVLTHEAANEIERLRAALERCVEVIEFAYMNAAVQPKELNEARAALNIHKRDKP